MSLVQHLHRPGAIRTWWEQRSAGLVPQVAQLGDLTTPVQPLSERGMQHAAAVGGVVGRLVETTIEAAPPYAAILAGGHRSDATLWPTHVPLAGTDEEIRAVEHRPTPTGWVHAVPGQDRAAWRRELAAVAEIERSPESTLGDRAAAAGIITQLETAYRGGGPVAPTPPSVITDAARIVSRLTRSTTRAAALCGGHLVGHAAPVLAPHWADGDVLLGPGRGGGFCLVDVKTVGNSTLRTAARVLPWLWQILSYVAADVDEDVWQIRAVGIWATRQDALIVWPVAELLATTDLRELAQLLRGAYEGDARAAGSHPRSSS